MKDAINVSKENYLKAILEAEAEGRAGNSGDAGALAGGVGSGSDNGVEAAPSATAYVEISEIRYRSLHWTGRRRPTARRCDIT